MTAARALIDVDLLTRELAAADPPTLLDVRWSLARSGRTEYAAGHLPGARFVDLDRDLCGPPGAGGRHPLPEPESLQRALRRVGVRAGHPVVVYDAGGRNPTGAAARAWWTLRWAGHQQVAVLDGGYAAWLAAGRPVTTEVPPDAPGDVAVVSGGLPVWDAVDAAAPGRILLDARVEARFEGAVEPVDAVAGHMPGARNVPAARTVGPDGRLLRGAALRAALAAALDAGGERGVGAYCGSGVTAAQLVLALAEAGVPAALYVGSWSHWITDPARPVATGAEPGHPTPTGAGE